MTGRVRLKRRGEGAQELVAQLDAKPLKVTLAVRILLTQSPSSGSPLERMYSPSVTAALSESPTRTPMTVSPSTGGIRVQAVEFCEVRTCHLQHQRQSA